MAVPEPPPPCWRVPVPLKLIRTFNPVFDPRTKPYPVREYLRVDPYTYVERED